MQWSVPTRRVTKTTTACGNILEAPAHASNQQKKVRCGEYEGKKRNKKKRCVKYKNEHFSEGRNA